jgi:hypothetical protein
MPLSNARPFGSHVCRSTHGLAVAGVRLGVDDAPVARPHDAGFWISRGVAHVAVARWRHRHEHERDGVQHGIRDPIARPHERYRI